MQKIGPRETDRERKQDVRLNRRVDGNGPQQRFIIMAMDDSEP